MKKVTILFIILTASFNLFSDTILLEEGFETDIFPPANWNSYQLGQSNDGWVSSLSHHTGEKSTTHATNFSSNDADDWLVFPALELSAQSKFEFYESSPYNAIYYNYHGLWISTGSGDPADGDFIELEEFDAAIGYWTLREIDLSSYASENCFLAFKYSGSNSSGADEWFIDAVKVYDLAIFPDLGVESTTGFVELGSSVFPKIEVSNSFDVIATDFEINVTIIDDLGTEVYNNTDILTGQSLGLGSEMFFMSAEWITPELGSYTITASVTSDGDENPANDILIQNCVISVSTARGQIVTNNEILTYGSFDLATGDFTTINTQNISSYPAAAEEFNGTNVYRFGADNSHVLEIINNDGTITLVGDIIGGYGGPTGMAWDWKNSIMYITFAVVGNKTRLYTLNLETLVATYIGEGSNTFIGIDFVADGFLYGPIVDSAYFGKIDPETGATSIVGLTGLNPTDVYFRQDVSYDVETNELYTITGNQANDSFKFGTYDLTTGAFTEISDFDQRVQTFVITKVPVLQATTLVSPIDESSDIAISGYLSWNPNILATGYKLFFGTDNPPSNIVNGDVQSELDFIYNVDNLTEYFWQIVPTDGTNDATDCPIWSFTTIIASDIESNYELAITNYELKQNYPNPFNPVTKISYQLAVSSKQLAEIVIYNSAGQKVWSSPVTRYGSPVTDFVLFDGSNLNSGIYYYSLIIDGKKMDTKSMVLIK